MNEPDKKSKERRSFTERVGRQEMRKLRAQKHKPLWLGFSVTGLVGWGIVIPSLLGLALGLWLDADGGKLNWTLMLFALGLLIGCFNAWHWVSKESDAIRREEEEER